MKSKKGPMKNDEIDDLESFIKKKKAQTEVLKKIITKLESNENDKLSK